MKTRLTIILISLIFCSFGQTDGYEKTKALYDKGKLQDAIDVGSSELKKLKNSDAAYKKIIRLRADCYMELPNFKSAIEDFKILIGLSPKEVSYYVAASYAYWELAEDANCFIYLQKAYEINPKDPGTLSNMTYYYGQAGKYEESIKYANIGLEQKDVSNTLQGAMLNNRGYAYISLKQFDKALKDINQSITFHPDNSYAYCYRALANIGLKKMETVCQDLDKAKSLGGVTLTKDLIAKHCKK